MELRPNAERAKNAILLVWIVTAIEVVSFLSGYMQYNLLVSVQNGGDISDDVATSNDLREQIIGIVLLVATVISIITFIQWFRRAYFNLHQQVDGLSWSEGWAAGAWFVPVLSLFRPYQIMKELYVQTNHLLVHRGFGITDRLSFSAIGWWWALWITSSILGQIVFRITLNAGTLEELINSTVLGMVTNIIAVPLAFLTVKVIRDYSRVEPLMHELVFDQERANEEPAEVTSATIQ